MDYLDICPPSAIYQIQNADPRKAESRNLIDWVEENANLQCTLAAMEAVAARLGPDSNPEVINRFCNAVASHALLLDPDQKAIIRAAYLRFSYRASSSFNYFLALRLTGIDIRAELRDRIRLDWTFATPYLNSESWDYYLYLASLNEPGALEALAKKIADTKNGNDATLLLESLADVPGKDVDAVLKLYANDPRTSDTPVGAGMPISWNIDRWLKKRGAK